MNGVDDVSRTSSEEKMVYVLPDSSRLINIVSKIEKICKVQNSTTSMRPHANVAVVRGTFATIVAGLCGAGRNGKLAALA